MHFFRTGIGFLFLLFVTSVTAQQLPLLPYPASAAANGESFTINSTTVIISSDACRYEATLFRDWLKENSGVQLKIVSTEEIVTTENFIMFLSGPARTFEEILESYRNLSIKAVPEEAIRYDVEDYKIMILPTMILVNSNQPAGIFYAWQTLKQLIYQSTGFEKFSLPLEVTGVNIEDRPAFRHRGMLLDCSRHFMSVDFIKKYIDVLAYYKMNVLHWHLTDDQGWRIEIKKYPELTAHGAWRTEENGERYGGYYTQEQIKEIVKYAADRYITVIPEIEIPGHSVAAISSYPWLSCTGEKIEVQTEWGVFKDIYCAGNDSTIMFIEQVLDEVCELFPSPYIHIGGDEVPKYHWEHCDKCQKRMKTFKLKSEAQLQTWMTNVIAEHLAKKGKHIIGWDEIMEGGIPNGATVQSWRGFEGGMKAADAKHFVIMSPTSHCYFDYPLSSTDMEEVYQFDPAPDDMGVSGNFVIGGECNLWSEHAPQEKVDSKVFPRLLAMSEVLWTHPASRNHESFRERVSQQYSALDKFKVDYGFESVPARITVVADKNAPVQLILDKIRPDDNLNIQYQLNNGVSAESTWKEYTEPIFIDDVALVNFKISKSGKLYDEPLSRYCQKHLGIACPVSLSYEPSPSYSGGGNNALVNGVLGSDQFRDGAWQAVQGKNMEATIDLGETTNIQSLSSRWYYYSNAWIFKPEKVEYFYSNDNVKWEKAGEFSFGKPADDPFIGSFPAAIENLNIQARYIRMKAINPGPCPSWHDAATEPSWLFCDEVVIK